MKLGNKIRELRKTKKVTLIELSKITGIAQATLSRIETGIMTGTVESHQKIAEALGASVAELYAILDDRAEKTVHEARDQHTAVSLRSDKVHCELLTAEATKKKIAPCLLRIESKGKTEVEKAARGVEKFYMVVTGSVVVEVNKKEYPLKPYETLYFDASLPHQVLNSSGRAAELFCVVSPPAL